EHRRLLPARTDHSASDFSSDVAVSGRCAQDSAGRATSNHALTSSHTASTSLHSTPQTAPYAVRVLHFVADSGFPDDLGKGQGDTDWIRVRFTRRRKTKGPSHLLHIHGRHRAR